MFTCSIVTALSFLINISLVVATDTTGQCASKLDAKDHAAKIYKDTLKWKEPVVTGDSNGVTFECKTGFLQNDIKTSKAQFTCNKGLYSGKHKFADLMCRSDYHIDDKIEIIPATQLNSKILNCNGRNLVLFKVSIKSTGKELYKVCFDTDTMRPKFSFKPATSTKPMYKYRSREDAVWGFDGFGQNAEDRLRLSRGYVKINQQRRTTASFPNKYNQGKSYPYYFNRGHLIAFWDFNEPLEQDATYQYINAAPQWEELNKYTWNNVEKEIRNIIKENSSEWDLYAGVYGNIPTTRGPLTLVPVFNEQGKFVKGQVPVPMLIWKIVFNQKDKLKSRVFIGVNNPEIRTTKEITGQYQLCNPMQSLTGTDSTGFYYECPIEKFLDKLKMQEQVVL